MSFVAFHDSVNAAFVSPGSSVGTVDAEMTFLEQITRRHATGDANAGAGRLAPAVIIGAPTAGFTTIGPSFAGAVDPADFEPVSTPSSPNADTEADEDDGAITGADATHDVPAGDFVASHTSTAPPAVVDVTARELTTIEPFLASDGDRAGFEPLSPPSSDAGEDNGSSTGVNGAPRTLATPSNGVVAHTSAASSVCSFPSLVQLLDDVADPSSPLHSY